MKPYVSAEDYAKTEKDFGKAKDEIEALDYEQVDWRQEGAYWVFEFKQTARMKDGKTDVDPKRSIYIVKEGEKWIVKNRKPE
jgi:hypothetical protein